MRYVRTAVRNGDSVYTGNSSWTFRSTDWVQIAVTDVVRLSISRETFDVRAGFLSGMPIHKSFTSVQPSVGAFQEI